MNHFSYYSEQTHQTKLNGHTMKKRNIVNIKNGKGIKRSEQTINKKTTRKQKTLSKKEMNHIRNNRFIPGLFRRMEN